MTTNVQKCKKLGILKDLKENNTEEFINSMSPREVLDAWLSWEGIYGYTHGIVDIINAFFKDESK